MRRLHPKNDPPYSSVCFEIEIEPELEMTTHLPNLKVTGPSQS